MSADFDTLELQEQFEEVIRRDDKLATQDFLNSQNISDVADLIRDNGDYAGQIIAILSPHPGRLRAEINSHQYGLHSLGGAEFQATAQRIHRLRELMPDQPFLLPGVGAQGGDPAELGPAFGGRANGALVSASRSVIYADDPAAAARTLGV